MPSSRADSMWSFPTQNLFSSANRIPIPDLHIQLSEREAHLKREIQAIRVFRNSLCPINRLPPELLSTIFLHLSDLGLQQRRKRTHDSSPLAWMDAALSVCDYWRNTALHCPTLWSTVGNEVFGGGMALLESVLSRSGSAPLKVECTNPQLPLRRVGEVRNGLYKLLATQTTRLQTLKIVNRVTDDGQEIGKIDIHRALAKMRGGAPMLKELVVKADNDVAFEESKDRLPDDFLQGGRGAPLLEQLSLLGCKLWKWEALPLGGGNMRKLSLMEAQYFELPPPESPYRPTAAQFFQSLVQMPLLEELELSRCLPLDKYPNAASTTPVVLPKLRSIAINDNARGVVSFMRATRARNLKTISIQLLEDDLPSDASDLVAFLKAFRTLLDGNATSARELAISPEVYHIENRRHHLKFTFSRKGAKEDSLAASESLPNSPDITNSNDPGQIVLQVSCHHGENQGIDTLFTAVKQTVDLSGLTDLDVEIQFAFLDAIPPHVWDETFGRLLQLQDITVIGEAGLSLLHALKNPCDEGGQHGATTFGALASITIEQFSFDDQKVALLIEVLSSRPTIRVLRLAYCYGFKRAYYDMVKEVLQDDNVEWDEISLSV